MHVFLSLFILITGIFPTLFISYIRAADEEAAPNQFLSSEISIRFIIN